MDETNEWKCTSSWKVGWMRPGHVAVCRQWIGATLQLTGMIEWCLLSLCTCMCMVTPIHPPTSHTHTFTHTPPTHTHSPTPLPHTHPLTSHTHTHTHTHTQAHSGSIWRVSWAHPEFGQVLATCSFDRTVIIWEEQGVAV